MALTRRVAITASVSSCFLAAAPPWAVAGPPGSLDRALRNPRDAQFLRAAGDPTKQRVESKLRKEGRKDPTVALDHSWNEARKDLPKGGVTVILDKEGNWSFTALFDPYRPKLPPPCLSFGTCPPLGALAMGSKLTGSPVGRNGAIIFALKSSLGYVMTWEAGGFISHTGLSWQKQGHDPIVKDLWSDVVKGHQWYGVSEFSPLMLQSTSAGAGGGRQEGNSGLGQVAGVLGTVGAIIAAFF